MFERQVSSRYTDRKTGAQTSSLRRFLEPLELFRSHALFRKGAPLDAGRADGPRVHVPALLARRIRLVAPNLDLLAALLAPDIFGLGLADLYASRASFFEHDRMIPLFEKNIYDVDHTCSNSK